MVEEHCDEGEERISPLLRVSNLQDGLIVFGLAVLSFLLLPIEAARRRASLLASLSWQLTAALTAISC
jgi:hypothetical protein